MGLLDVVPDLEEELIRKINSIITDAGWKITKEKWPAKPSGLDMIMTPPDPNQIKRFSFSFMTPMGPVEASVKARANSVEYDLKGPMGTRNKKFKVTRYAYLDSDRKHVRIKNKEDLVGEVHLMMVYFAPVNNLKLTPRQIEKLRFERTNNPMAPPPVGLPKQVLDRLLMMQPQQPGGPLPPLETPPGMMPGQYPPGMVPPGMMPPGMMPGQYPPGMAPPGMVPPGMPQQVPPSGYPQQPMQPQQQPQAAQPQQPAEPPAPQVPKLTECPQCGSPLGDPQPDGTYKCDFCGAVIEP